MFPSSLRQQSGAAPRAAPACRLFATPQMDALGFGLESYDATGAWRTHRRQVPHRTRRVRYRTAGRSGDRSNSNRY